MPKLSFAERVMLVNQFRILEKVDEENAEGYQKAITVFEHGYELWYSECTQHVDEQTLSDDECKRVLDAMSMYAQMQSSFRELKPGGKASHLDFPGFDGNNESKRLAFALFLIKQEGRFADLQLASKDLNSHSRATVDLYDRMLPVWSRIREQTYGELTLEQIGEIISESIHPSRRAE